MAEAFFAFLGVVVTSASAVVLWWLKSRREDRKEKEKRALASEKQLALWRRDEKINNKLRALRIEYQADRIYVSLLHNGDTFQTGRSFQKLSMVYEECDTHINGHLPLSQNWSTAPIALTLHQLQMNGYYVRGKEMGNESDRFMMHRYDIEVEYLFSITDDYGLMVGLLGLDYIEQHKELSDDRIERLRAMAGRFFPFLEDFKPVVKLADLTGSRSSPG